MKGRSAYFIVLLFAVVVLLPFRVQAELFNRGTDSRGNRLIYDSDLNITWYDYTNTYIDGTWQNQMNWADALIVDFGGEIYDDWRLPTALNQNGTGPCNGSNCIGSEMGHLFYVELENVGAQDSAGNSTGCFPYCLTNRGEFQNLVSSAYWLSTEYALEPNCAYVFSFISGSQPISYITLGPYMTYLYAIAVRTGDVVPADSDGDGFLNDSDNCPTVANSLQEDIDQDNIGDVCDIDIDGDGVENNIDNCQFVQNIGQEDIDGDGDGDDCDIDDDNDSVLDEYDNCRLIPNPDQSDYDGEGRGDVCDDDIDGDVVANEIDNCQYAANSNQYDWNSDGEGDACDADVDGDDVVNESDLCAFSIIGTIVDPSSGCSIEQLNPCQGPRGTTIAWKNHGQYVASVAKTTNGFLALGLITEEEKAAIVSAAASSACGQK